MMALMLMKSIDIEGAKDISNVQIDHTATVGLEVDTARPTSATVVIEVADNDQTEQEATASYTVKSTDADPGTIHGDMRGSEFLKQYCDFLPWRSRHYD